MVSVRVGAGGAADEDAGASGVDEPQAPPSVAASSSGSKDNGGRRTTGDMAGS